MIIIHTSNPLFKYMLSGSMFTDKGPKTFRTAASPQQVDFDKHSKSAQQCISVEEMKRIVSLHGILFSSLLKMSLPYGTFLLVRLSANVNTTELHSSSGAVCPLQI